MLTPNGGSHLLELQRTVIIIILIREAWSNYGGVVLFPSPNLNTVEPLNILLSKKGQKVGSPSVFVIISLYTDVICTW